MNWKTMPMAVALAAIAASIAVPVAAAAPTVRAEVTNGTLTVTGSQAADRIALRLSKADANQLQVDVGDDGSADATFDLGSFRAINVAAGNGDDTVRIDQVNGIFTTTKATRIDGGNGDDTLIGGSGNEVLVGGRGDDVVDGNGGTDTAFLGKGDDTFIWDPGDGSDVVEGDSGSDTMIFNGAGGNEIMTAKANGDRVSFTRNLGTIVMDLDGIEAIDVNALGGTDTITVDDLSGTDLSRVNIDLAAALGGSAADGAADTVTVTGTDGNDTIAADANGAAVDVSGLPAAVRITHADPALDKLVIDTLAGADSVELDPALPGLIGACCPVAGAPRLRRAIDVATLRHRGADRKGPVTRPVLLAASRALHPSRPGLPPAVRWIGASRGTLTWHRCHPLVQRRHPSVPVSSRRPKPAAHGRSSSGSSARSTCSNMVPPSSSDPGARLNCFCPSWP